MVSAGKNPAASEFHFPAEWERHDAVFLAWPHDRESFPDIVAVEKTYCEIIRALQMSDSEMVKLYVLNKDMLRRVKKILKMHGCRIEDIQFFLHDYGDVWFRDYGPSFVINNEPESKKRKNQNQLAMIKWEFNAWGNKYPELLKDDRIPFHINQEMKIQMFEPGIVMEGGAIEINGDDVLLTTEQCLLNKNRNPTLTKMQIESILKQHLRITTVIWLKEGIAGDDTDGHIDNLARFVNADTILCAYEDDEQDENYNGLKRNYDTLSRCRDRNGKRFNIVKLPMPKLFVKSKGSRRRLPASYANFYIANKAVLVPIYKHSNDARALKIIKTPFPERRIIAIDCRSLVFGFGAIHCIAQQQPVTGNQGMPL